MKKRWNKLEEKPYPILFYILLTVGLAVLLWTKGAFNMAALANDSYKLDQFISWVNACILGIIFILLGRVQESNRVDPGYLWLGVALFAWQLMAAVKLSIAPPPKGVLIWRYREVAVALISIANSIALLAAMAYFEFLKDRTNRLFWFLKNFQQFLQRRVLQVLLPIIVALLLLCAAFIFIKHDPFGSVLPGMRAFLQILQFVINCFVCFLLPLALWYIFKERDVAHLNLVVIPAFALVLVYEIITLIVNIDPSVQDFIVSIYRLFIYIIFFSLSVSYRVYRGKLDLQQLRFELFKREKSSPIENFLASLFFVFRSFHGGGDNKRPEDILRAANGVPNTANTLHGDRPWQKQ